MRVVGATIAADGSKTLKFGKADGENAMNTNPWDEVLIDAAHKERAS